jgi:hypothetical protein
MKHAAFYICMFFIACTNSNSADQNQLATNSAKETAEANTSAAANPGNDDIIGEWKLTMWIGEKNANGKIDDDERAAALTGVNDYMKLSSDGSAIFTQFKWEGRYEIKSNSDGTTRYLNLFDKAGTKYAKGAIISVTKTELTLLGYSTGPRFSIWKRL